MQNLGRETWSPLLINHRPDRAITVEHWRFLLVPSSHHLRSRFTCSVVSREPGVITGGR